MNYVTQAPQRAGWGVAVGLARAQHGVVALWQLAQAGVRPATVRGWVRAKRLVPLYRGVFAAGHDSLRREGLWLAAVLACGPGAVLSHAAAGALWGIRRSAATRIDVTAPIRTGRRQLGLRVHRADHLRPDEVTIRDGVPCTTLARTLLDLAGVLQEGPLRAAVEAAERLELLDLRALNLLLARYYGRAGTGRLRRVLARYDAEAVRARSEGEAALFHLCVDSGLPRPLVNRVISFGAESFELDLHWPEAHLAVEVDSPFHDTTEARLRDAHRDAVLRSHGWNTLRVRDDVATVLPDIRAHLLALGQMR
jgi:very-short-patch-repair endonuclease